VIIYCHLEVDKYSTSVVIQYTVNGEIYITLMLFIAVYDILNMLSYMQVHELLVCCTL